MPYVLRCHWAMLLNRRKKLFGCTMQPIRNESNFNSLCFEYNIKRQNGQIVREMLQQEMSLWKTDL